MNYKLIKDMKIDYKFIEGNLPRLFKMQKRSKCMINGILSIAFIVTLTGLFSSQVFAFKALAEPSLVTGLHKGEWVKYKAVYYTPKISQEMKELANNSESFNHDKNFTISNVQWFKVTIKDVQNSSYVFDSTIYLKNGTEMTKTNLIGNFEPTDKYMLVVPINLQIGDTIKGMTLLQSGLVKDILSKPILGQNINVFEIVENNRTSTDNYTTESYTDSFYDKKTGILLHSSASISFSSPELGSNIGGYEIEAIDFSDALPSDTHAAVPEFPFAILSLIIASFSIVLISRVKQKNTYYFSV